MTRDLPSKDICWKSSVSQADYTDLTVLITTVMAAVCIILFQVQQNRTQRYMIRFWVLLQQANTSFILTQTRNIQNTYQRRLFC